MPTLQVQSPELKNPVPLKNFFKKDNNFFFSKAVRNALFA
jgi:hypothetical protein